jgi:hypothetical protein
MFVVHEIDETNEMKQISCFRTYVPVDILGIEFDRYLLEHPEVIEQIPDGAEVHFLPEEDPDLLQENLKIAEAQKAGGGRVVLVRIGKLSPPRSRLQDVRLESLSI